MLRLKIVQPFAAAALLVLMSPVLETAAMAGEYKVYSCKTPSGMVAPTDGWTGSRGASVFSDPVDACRTGGPLVAELNRNHSQPANSALVTWGWSAPPGAAIAAYRVWRNAFVLSAGEPAATPFAFITRPVNDATGANVADYCAAGYGCLSLGASGPGLSPANLLAEDLRTFTPVTNWYINAGCGGVNGEYCFPRSGVMSLAQVHAAEFTLRDPEAPIASDVTGRLTSATAHSGTELVSFRATDSVSGVYRAHLEVDGKIVRTTVVDSNDGRCADAGVDPGSPYEFMYRVPCKKSVQHDVAVDTRTLSDGTHNVRVLVEDAAGNRTSVWASPEFVVQNGTAAAAGAPAGVGPKAQPTCANGSGALGASFTRNDARRLTLTHGSAFGIRGRGPANADIDVFHVRGGKTSALGSVRASASGSFAKRFRARHGSGTIRLCGPGVATALTLRVKAKVSLKVRLSRGGMVRYSGRVATGQIPKGGKIVAIQGKAGPNWQTFAIRRTDRNGRFKGRYRLRVVIPGRKLKFRVRVPSEAGYPFVGVVGKSVTKRVR